MNESDLRPVWIAFEPGTRVVLEDGPLKGIRGTVLGWNETPSLIVLVAMSDGSVIVEQDPRWVSVEEPTPARKLPVH